MADHTCDNSATSGGPAGTGSARLMRIALWVLPALAAVLAHLPALGNGFVHDDFILLVDNPYLHHLSGLGHLLGNNLFASTGDLDLSYYRPLSSIVYWLSWQLFGADAPLQHALNLLLHAGVALALARLLARLGASTAAAAVAAALFAAHPATSDIVAYVGGRQEMLGWLLLLVGLPLAIGERGRVSLAGIAAAAAAAGLAHEYFLCAPLLFALVSINGRVGRARYLAMVRCGGAAALGTLLVLGLRAAVGIGSAGLAGLDTGSVVTAAAFVMWRTTSLVIVPTDLSPEVSVPPWSPLLVGAVIVIGLGVTAAAAWVALRRPRGGRTLYIVAAAIVVSVAALHAFPVARFALLPDRYAYGVVLAGAAALAGAIAELEIRWTGRRWRRLAGGLATAILIASIPLSWSRDVDFASDETLQLAMLRDRPDDPQSWLAAGMALFWRGDLDRAYPLCERFRQARPAQTRANLCVATYLLAHGQARPAAALLAPYVARFPGHVRGRVTLLRALFASGQLQRVAALLDALQRRYPAAPDLAAARAELLRRRANTSSKAAPHPPHR